MLEHHATLEATEPSGRAESRWQAPAFEVICLACEISAYAPDDGGPLF